MAERRRRRKPKSVEAVRDADSTTTLDESTEELEAISQEASDELTDDFDIEDPEDMDDSFDDEYEDDDSEYAEDDEDSHDNGYGDDEDDDEDDDESDEEDDGESDEEYEDDEPYDVDSEEVEDDEEDDEDSEEDDYDETIVECTFEIDDFNFLIGTGEYAIDFDSTEYVELTQNQIPDDDVYHTLCEAFEYGDDEAIAYISLKRLEIHGVNFPVVKSAYPGWIQRLSGKHNEIFVGNKPLADFMDLEDVTISPTVGDAIDVKVEKDVKVKCPALTVEFDRTIDYPDGTFQSFSFTCPVSINSEFLKGKKQSEIRKAIKVLAHALRNKTDLNPKLRNIIGFKREFSKNLTTLTPGTYFIRDITEETVNKEDGSFVSIKAELLLDPKTGTFQTVTITGRAGVRLRESAKLRASSMVTGLFVTFEGTNKKGHAISDVVDPSVAPAILAKFIKYIPNKEMQKRVHKQLLGAESKKSTKKVRPSRTRKLAASKQTKGEPKAPAKKPAKGKKRPTDQPKNTDKKRSPRRRVK